MTEYHALAEQLGVSVRQLALGVRAAAEDAGMDTEAEDSAETCFEWFKTLPLEAQMDWVARAPKVTT